MYFKNITTQYQTVTWTATIDITESVLGHINNSPILWTLNTLFMYSLYKLDPIYFVSEPETARHGNETRDLLINSFTPRRLNIKNKKKSYSSVLNKNI